MLVYITQTKWDQFLNKYENTYMTMQREGRALAEKLARKRSELQSNFHATNYVHNKNYRIYASEYPDDVREILSSRYYQAYTDIMYGISDIRKEERETERNNTREYTADTRYEAVHILVHAMAGENIFSPCNLTMALNHFISYELRIGNAPVDNFFPMLTIEQLEALSAPIAPDDDNQSQITAHFQLQCMQALLALGCVLLVIALVTCPAIAPILGIASATTSQISIATAIGSGISFLLFGGIHAMRRSNGDIQPESTSLQRSFP